MPGPNPDPILVSGGLVESRDPTMYESGTELLRAQDAYYKPHNPAVWSVRGNAEFNSSAVGAALIGLRYLEYDGANDIIIVTTGDTIYEATAGLTGAFSSVVTGLTPTGVTSIDSCKYNNQHIVFDGVNRNRVRESDGTWRLHGMLYNTDPPTIGVAGAGSGFILGLGQTLTYWIEEQVRDGLGKVTRRNATPSIVQTITLTGAGVAVKPRIFRPPVVNPDATHWALYVTGVNGVFPIGACIGTALITDIFIDDLRSSFVLPPLTVIPPGTWAPVATLINQANQQALAAAALQPLSAGLPSGEVYETIGVVLDNLVTIAPKNGAPPISSSMDVQEDSVVMNDVNDRTRVWFTYSDQRDVVPPTNFIRFETKDGGLVKWVKFLGRGTMVGLEHALWRIDTLPQPSDAAFQIARVKVEIDGAFGGTGARAVTKFSMGERSLIAYAAQEGLCATDGETWFLLSLDIDWPTRVDVSQLETALLENNPTEFRLEFTYTPVGGAHNSATLFFHYHPSHIKASGPGTIMTKVTGTINRGATAKTLATVSGQRYIFSAQTNGKVYREWTGLTNLLADINFDILTGDKFPFGVGKRAQMPRAWVHHQAGGATQRATFVGVQRTEGLNDSTETRDFPLARREHTSVYPNLEGEAFQFGVRATNPTAQIAIDFFIPEFEDGGEASSDGEA